MRSLLAFPPPPSVVLATPHPATANPLPPTAPHHFSSSSAVGVAPSAAGLAHEARRAPLQVGRGFQNFSCGGDGVAIQADMSQPDGIASLFKATAEAYDSPVGVLVNNAGITRDTLAMRMKQKQWEQSGDESLEFSIRMLF